LPFATDEIGMETRMYEEESSGDERNKRQWKGSRRAKE
jgi:hypothetical protein